jgi:hypothetical protein
MHPSIATLLGGLIAIAVSGCNRLAAPPVKGPAVAPAVIVEAPKGDEIEDPVLREARAATDEILSSMLAVKAQEDSGSERIAKKIGTYQAAVITSQKMTGKDAARFEGKLTAPTAQASFQATVVKQQNGKWAIGSFSGPNAE